MHTTARVPASKRQSMLSSTSLQSNTSHASTYSSASSHPSSPATWIPYASMRAVGTVHNRIVERHRQQALDAQLEQVAQLPTTPRRQHMYKPPSPPQLPPLEIAASAQQGGQPDELDAVAEGHKPQEEQKEAIVLSSHRSTTSTTGSRPTTATKSARSHRSSTISSKSTTSNISLAPPPDNSPPTDSNAQPVADTQADPTPTDPLPAYLSTNQPSIRLARLAHKQRTAHEALAAALHARLAAHKQSQREAATRLAARCLAAYTALGVEGGVGRAAAAVVLVDEFEAELGAVVERGLVVVGREVREVVERMIEVGWRREGEIWAELREVVDAWNVWTVRNRRSVAELVYLLRRDELERQEKEAEHLAKEAAEKQKELAASQSPTAGASSAAVLTAT